MVVIKQHMFRYVSIDNQRVWLKKNEKNMFYQRQRNTIYPHFEKLFKQNSGLSSKIYLNINEQPYLSKLQISLYLRTRGYRTSISFVARTFSNNDNNNIHKYEQYLAKE